MERGPRIVKPPRRRRTPREAERKLLRGPAQTFGYFARAPQPAAAQPDVGAVNHRADDIKPPEPDLELDEAARIVVDAAMEVHRIVGPGLIESVYEQALRVELGLRGVHCARQVPVAVTYNNVAIGHARIDFLVGEHLVVELKACQALLPVHFAQVLSYLKASDRSLGLLIHFNVRLLRQGVRRVIRSR